MKMSSPNLDLGSIQTSKNVNLPGVPTKTLLSEVITFSLRSVFFGHPVGLIMCPQENEAEGLL